MLRRHSIWILFILLAACAASSPPVGDSPPGATVAKRTSLGYELSNPHMQIIIDADTGDVVQFFPAGEKSGPLSLAATLNGFRGARPQGHVESRDDQTWAYIGTDSQQQVGWRKIYCLDGHWLDVSYIAQNLRSHPIFLQIGLAGNFATTHPDSIPPGEVQMTVDSRDGLAHHYYFQAFDVSQAVQRPEAPGHTFLHSDVERLNPGQRMSWTMRWWIGPNDR